MGQGISSQVFKLWFVVLDQVWGQKCPDVAQEYPKWSAGGSQTEPWRVQNGAQWPERGPMPPQVSQRGSSAAWSSPSRRQDASQGAQGRLVHGFASDLGPQNAPQGVPNRSKKRTKSVSKNIFVSDRVLETNFIDLGVRKASFLGRGNGLHTKIARRIRKKNGKTNQKSTFSSWSLVIF